MRAYNFLAVRWARFCAVAASLSWLLVCAGVSAGPFSTSSGDGEVSNGAFIYKIPIRLPAGTAGVVPEFSLIFNSHHERGDGVLGRGWQFGGLSRIVGCRFTAGYCLDGDRLLLRRSAPGNVSYTMERDIYAKITARGDVDGVPRYFEVRTKDGRKITFGRASGGITAANGKVAAWPIGKVEDKKGNYWTINYRQTGTNIAHYPTELKWTGNDLLGLATYNKLSLQYETKPELAKSYSAGHEEYVGERLSELAVYSSGNLLARHRIGYSAANALAPSQITAVQTCDAHNRCQLPVTFETPFWSASGIIKRALRAAGLADAQITRLSLLASPSVTGGNIRVTAAVLLTTILSLQDAQSGGADGVYRSGDFDGDGRTALLHIADAGVDLFSYRGDGQFERSGYRKPVADYDMVGDAENPRNFKVGDFDGDGRDDLLHLIGGITATVWRSAGDGTFVLLGNPLAGHNWGGEQTAAAQKYQLHDGDFNGDGLTDFVHITNTDRASVLLATGNGGFRNAGRVNLQAVGEVGYRFTFGDFNGDGLTDFFQVVNAGEGYVYRATGDGGFVRGDNVSPAGYNLSGSADGEYVFVSGDFNGDGLTDLLHARADNPGRVWLSKGDFSFAQGNDVGAGGLGGSGLLVLDMNGDGKSDILQFKSGGVVREWLSVGDGSFAVGDGYVKKSGYAVETMGENSRLGDFDGDGAIDALHLAGDNQLRLWRGTLTPLHYLPAAVHNDGGNDVEIAYQTFVGPGAGKLAAGNRGAQKKRVVVVTLDFENGRQVAYRYEKPGVDSKRNAGFGRVIKTDKRINLETATDYHRIFPYTGLTAKMTQTDGDNRRLLSLDKYRYALKRISFNGVIGNAVLLTSRQEMRWDLDGSAMPVRAATYRYDNDGNILTLLLTTSDGWGKRTENRYKTSPTERAQKMLATIKVTSWNKDSMLSQETVFRYDNDGYVTAETASPGNATLWAGRSYQRDGYGNVVVTRVSAYGVANHIESSLRFDARGRFVTEERNSLGHLQKSDYDETLGVVLTVTDANGLKTKRLYDSFGRITLENRPGGGRDKTSYSRCGGGCPTAAAYYVKRETADGGGDVVYYDEFDRRVETRWAGFDGRRAAVREVYDEYGRETRKSQPFYPGEANHWTETSYDKLGRPLRVQLPPGGENVYEYHGLQLLSVNANGQQTKSWHDSQGNVVRVQEARADGLVGRVDVESFTHLPGRYLSGDFDGDGDDDLLRAAGDYYEILQGGKLETITRYGDDALSALKKPLAVDWNGDGRVDIVDIGETLKVYLSGADGFADGALVSSAGDNLSALLSDYMASDYDGDGLPELGSKRGGAVDVLTDDGDDSAAIKKKPPPSPAGVFNIAIAAK